MDVAAEMKEQGWGRGKMVWVEAMGSGQRGGAASWGPWWLGDAAMKMKEQGWGHGKAVQIGATGSDRRAGGGEAGAMGLSHRHRSW